MHHTHFSNWPPRLPSGHFVSDNFAELHQPKPTPSQGTTGPTPHPHPHSLSAPTTPSPEDTRSQRSPSRTDLASPVTTTTAAGTSSSSSSTARPPRPFSANSIRTDPLSLKNTVAGGLLSSPTSVPGAGYLPHYGSSSSSSSAQKSGPTATTATNRHRTSIITGAGASWMDTLIRDYPSTESSNNKDRSIAAAIHQGDGANHNSNNSEASHRKPPLHQPQGIRPFHHPLQQSPRSMSFAGSASAANIYRSSAAATTPHSDSGETLFATSPLRKSQTVGKTSKKGFKSRFKKLQRKQGSSGSRETSSTVNAFITSGDSDSEAAFEQESDIMFNSGGIIQKFIPSAAGGSKSSLISRPKLPSIDPSLPPPQPPPRRNSVIGVFTRSSNSGAQSGSEFGGHETPKESSTVRFKDLFKSVGLSSPHPSGLAPAATASANITTGTSGANAATTTTAASHSGLSDHGIHTTASKPVQSRSTFHVLGEFLSGDDQPTSTGGSLSKGFRLKGAGKRKKRFTKKSRSATAELANFPTGITDDDEDSSASRTGRRRLSNHPSHSQHQHQQGHEHQQHPPQQQHGIQHQWSQRHRSRSTGEENRFQPLAAWRPEPRISSALKQARQDCPDPNILLVELEPLPRGFVNTFEALSTPKASQQQQQPQPQHHFHHGHSQSLTTVEPLTNFITPSSTAGSGYSLPFQYHGSPGALTTTTAITSPHGTVAKCTDSILSKTFLFRFYQNSKLQGHYVFRVVNDRVEYKILPKALEPACSQYFHRAYMTYRTLDKKAKAIKEEKERSRRINQLWTATSPTSPRSRETMENFHLPNSDNPSPKRQGSEDKIMKSSIAWDQVVRLDGGTSILSQSPRQRSLLHTSRTIGYQDQRYNPQHSNNAIVRSFAGGGPDRSKSDITERSIAAASAAATSTAINFSNISPIPPPLPPRSAHFHARNRSWSSITDQQRSDQPRVLLQAQEETKWIDMERKYREEVQQATYGLQLYLNEVIRGMDYERFDASADVAITNDNRDSAVFTIVNGDRTNEMWLESPSMKLKYEFMHWIAISTMGHNETSQDSAPSSHDSVPAKSSLDMFMGSQKEFSGDTAEDGDLLLEMIELRQALQQERLQQMRERIQGTMRQIEGCLHELDRLDDGAKKRMTEMIAAIDSQKVQVALRPSPTTGLTLTATVQGKLNDVQERIRVCKKIMYAARFNLNRLKYEIELEQRSVRLFRQYMIIIGLVSFMVIILLWSRRDSSRAHTPGNPIGNDYLQGNEL